MFVFYQMGIISPAFPSGPSACVASSPVLEHREVIIVECYHFGVEWLPFPSSKGSLGQQDWGRVRGRGTCIQGVKRKQHYWDGCSLLVWTHPSGNTSFSSSAWKTQEAATGLRLECRHTGSFWVSSGDLSTTHPPAHLREFHKHSLRESPTPNSLLWSAPPDMRV